MNDNYTKMSLEELIIDQEFIDFVLEQKDKEKWEKWISTHEDNHTKAEEARKMIVGLSEGSIKIDETNKRKIWAGILKRTTRKPNTVRRLVIAASAIAACFALVLLIKPTKENITIANDSNETMEYVLPDQSFVVLDKQAEISFDKKNYVENRLIDLKGQAYFEVIKGSHFEVKTKKGRVEVLGTSFNVNSNTGFEVTCFTGKVKVSFDDKEAMLHPGEKTSFKLHDFTSEKIEFSQQKPEWVSGSQKFENTHLDEVFAQFEKIYKVKVEIPDEIDKKAFYTGSFVKDDIEKALLSITWPMHLKYSLEGDKVYITKD